jgi:hypothetical protein
MATVIKIRQQQQNQDGVTERRIDWMQISNTVFTHHGASIWTNAGR